MIFLFFSLFLCGLVRAQSQSQAVTVPVPPLQWIRLQTTTNAPALAYAAAAIDTVHSHLVLFGGETSGGLTDGNTHLLNLRSFNWSSPPTTSTGIGSAKPPARSRALGAHDLIASYRNGFLLYGGRASDGSSLSDVWEYAFNGQFWTNITVRGDIPPPRWGAVGGGDPPVVNNIDSNLLTTFWMAGGATVVSNGQAVETLDYNDVYRLQMSGTVAQNYIDGTATWAKVASTASNVKGRIGQAGLVYRTDEGKAKLGIYGGCTGSQFQTLASVNQECAQADSYVLSTGDSSPNWETIAQCPSPRVGASFVPTLNHLFSDMAFLLFGLSPNANTTDAAALEEKGEIDVLSLSQGVWTRVVPSCDPSSTPPCPVARQGAAVVSSPNPIVGTGIADGQASDVIVFGGKDKDGNVLSDVWILRATAAQTTFSNQTTWGAQFGDGTLGSGPDTNGQGVSVQFLTDCSSSASGSGPSSTTSSGGAQPSGSNGHSGFNSVGPTYRVGTAHQVLAGTSVLAILMTVLFARWAGFSVDAASSTDENPKTTTTTTTKMALLFLAIASWMLGVVGFVVSFTSTRKITSATSKARLIRRDGGSVFGPTPHAIVGCVLFGAAYILTPLVILSRSYARKRMQKGRKEANGQVEELPTLHHGYGRDASANSTPGEKAHPFGSHNIRSSVHSQSMSTALNNPSIATALNTLEGGGEQERAHKSRGEETGDEDDGDEPLGAGHRERLRARRPAFAPSAFFKWPSSWTVLPTPVKRGQDADTKGRRRLSSQASTPMLPRNSLGTQPPSRPASVDASAPAAGGETGFVVLNRGRHALDRMTHATPSHTNGNGARSGPVTLSDVSWLERRRNMNLVSEMDYAMSQLRSSKRHSTSALMDVSPDGHSEHDRSPRALASGRRGMEFPKRRVVLLHLMFHALLCALVVYTAVALFSKTRGNLGVPLGVVFVLCAVAYYVGVVLLALRGRPGEGSVLVVGFGRLRGHYPSGSVPHGSNGDEDANGVERERAISPLVDGVTVHSSRASRAFYPPHDGVAHAGREDEEDEGEEIEREMGRRDVSIVTVVPKRRLFIANGDTLS